MEEGVQWLCGSKENDSEVRRQILLKCNLVNGGKVLMSADEMATECRRSWAMVYSVHRGLSEHWTGLRAQYTKFYKTSSIAINTKLTMGRRSWWSANKRDFCFRISCSHGSGQWMTRKFCRQSPFQSERMCQYTELPNMGNRKSTWISTCTTSFSKGHCVLRF